MATEMEDRYCEDVSHKIRMEMESMRSGVEDLMLIAKSGSPEMLRSSIDTMIDRAMIVGYKYGQSASTVWCGAFAQPRAKIEVKTKH